MGGPDEGLGVVVVCVDVVADDHAVRRLIAARIPLDGAADHGVSEALYLRDPDGNGVELYTDRPHQQWPRNPDGSLAMHTRLLDVEALARLGT